MASYSAFTFVSALFIMGLTSLVYIFVTPMFDIFIIYANSLAPVYYEVFDIMQLFWTYLMLPVVVGMVLYFIANSQNID